MTETGEGHDTDNQGSVCKVGTQDPENLDEELKPLVTVWSLRALRYASRLPLSTPSLSLPIPSVSLRAAGRSREAARSDGDRRRKMKGPGVE